jgi:phosphatidate cytidylyltransferase
MPTFVSDSLAAVPTALLWGLGGVLATLLLGTAAALGLPVVKPGRDWTNLKLRVWSWWVMIALIVAALLGGPTWVTTLFAVVSFLALREFLSLAPTRREDRLIVLFAYLTIPVCYLLVGFDQYLIYLVAIPVWFFILTPFLMALAGQTRGYLASLSMFNWGVIACVYSIGFAPLLMHVPQSEVPEAGAAGLVFFLLVATEANDVLQYVTGKLFGRRKILPSVSPNKTWEGFLGGWLLTGALIWLAAPIFTPIDETGRWMLAVLMPLAGFAGDVTMSAVKRDLGVKDTSSFIPGHGGVLDRIDSLTFTAPLYFHLLAYYGLAKY